MARKKGQTYTPEQKAKVVLELLKEEKTFPNLTPKCNFLIKNHTSIILSC